MRVVTVTTFFPNAADRQRAVFIENLVRAMMSRCRMDVVSPVPRVPPFGNKPEWCAQRGIPREDSIEGIPVHHPRFVVVPKLGLFSGLGYFLGILRTLRNLTRRGPLVVHAHCAYPDAVGVALAARLLRIPYVVTAHGSDINVYAERPSLRPQIRWALRHAAGVVAVSGPLESKIRTLIGDAPVPLVRIPCAGVDAKLFAPRLMPVARQALGLPLQGGLVLFVGQLVPIKGVEFLLDAWIQLAREGRLDADDLLCLVGDGPLRQSLEARARAGGIADRIRFVGMVPQTDVARWVAAASLLCLPSRNEGTPNVVVEALASGVPVVASRVGGIPDLVREGESGLLVPPGDVPALSAALARGLGANWDSRSIAASVADLTWDAIAQRNCEFLQEVSPP